MKLRDILRIDKLIFKGWFAVKYKVFLYGKWNFDQQNDFIMIGNNSGLFGAMVLSLITGMKLRFVFERQYFDSLKLKFLWKILGYRAFGADDSPEKKIKLMTTLGKDVGLGKKICFLSGCGIVPDDNVESFVKAFHKFSRREVLKIMPIFIGGTKSDSRFYFNVMIPDIGNTNKVISVNFAKVHSFENDLWKLRRSISQMMSNYYEDLKKFRRPLIEYFIKAARKHIVKECIRDKTGKKLNYKQTLAAVIIAADKLKKYVGEHRYVGILLPPSVAGVISNFAMNLLGKIVVNLNYSTGDGDWQFAANKTGIEKIITSRLFLKRINFAPDDQRFIFIEDFVKNLTRYEKLRGWFKANFLPIKTLSGTKDFNSDSTAAILFTSGSSGDPKGVVLSHHNIISNIEQMTKIFKIYDTDKLCGVLPFFHSFGYTVSLWLAMLTGVGTYYVTNPLDSSEVANAVEDHKATILFGTPTFLKTYSHRIESQKFTSLQRVIAGAEKLKPNIAIDFKDKFGVEPREGYGTTELSPVVSVNPDNNFAIGKGNKIGSVGFVLPGTSVKIIDLETGNECEPGDQGKIFLTGPSVMRGYFDEENLTKSVFVEGWYDTGDIGHLDEDRYLTVSDRLSRFSKIGGEMVSHSKVENVVNDKIGNGDQIIAVTGIPDENKGEQLVVICNDSVDIDEVKNVINNSNLGNIYKPKGENYFKVDQLPFLGSGKLDLVMLKQMALRFKGMLD